MKRKPELSFLNEGELPARLLADVDSLFMACQGITLHYKLRIPGSPSRSLSSTTFLDNPSLKLLSENQYNLRRSFSNQFHASSLCTPLLDGSPTSPVLSQDMPMLSLNEASENDGSCQMGSPRLEVDLEANGQFGIVLVHGFGGGVFSWRNVMDVLSRQHGCVVAAFDRPGWGLTSRPRCRDWQENQLPNPYKLDSQVVALF